MPRPNRKNAPIEREVRYPAPKTELCVGENALTFAQACDLAGFKETQEPKGRLFTLCTGVGAIFTNNNLNRPFREPDFQRLIQEILNDNWVFNGEAMQIGKTGELLSAQHRLAAFIAAEYMRRNDEKWKERHPKELTLECLIVFGIDESARTTQTIDRVEPRTDGDILYCDRSLFNRSGCPSDSGTREKLCKMLAVASKLCWQRTGGDTDTDFANTNAELMQWTPSVAVDFTKRHPFLEDACIDILKHDKDREATNVANHKEHGNDPSQKGYETIEPVMSLGKCAAILYLMAASQADRLKYVKQGRTQDLLDLEDLVPVLDLKGKPVMSSNKDKQGNLLPYETTEWEVARTFFRLLHNQAALEMKPIRTVLAKLASEEYGAHGSVHDDDKTAVLVKAYPYFREGQLRQGGKAIRADQIKPDYQKVDGTDRYEITCHPILGDGKVGIDIGKRGQRDDTPSGNVEKNEEREEIKEEIKNGHAKPKGEEKPRPVPKQKSVEKSIDEQMEAVSPGITSLPTKKPVPKPAPRPLGAKPGKPPLKGGIG